MIDDDFPPMAGQSGATGGQSRPSTRPADLVRDVQQALAYPDLATAAATSGSDQELPTAPRQRRHATALALWHSLYVCCWAPSLCGS